MISVMSWGSDKCNELGEVISIMSWGSDKYNELGK